ALAAILRAAGSSILLERALAREPARAREFLNHRRRFLENDFLLLLDAPYAVGIWRDHRAAEAKADWDRLFQSHYEEILRHAVALEALARELESGTVRGQIYVFNVTQLLAPGEAGQEALDRMTGTLADAAAILAVSPESVGGGIAVTALNEGL